MEKFKVGDICEVKEGDRDKCGSFNDSGRKNKYIKITRLDNGYYYYEILGSDFTKRDD